MNPDEQDSRPLEQVAAPKAPRLACEAKEPFQLELPHGQRCTPLAADEELERGTDAKRNAAGSPAEANPAANQLALRSANCEEHEISSLLLDEADDCTLGVGVGQYAHGRGVVQPPDRRKAR